MKNLIIILLSLGLLFGLTACKESAVENTTPSTTIQPQAKPKINSQTKQPMAKPGEGSPINWMTFDEAQKCWIETPSPIRNWLNMSMKTSTQSNSTHRTKTTLCLQERPSPIPIMTQIKVSTAATEPTNLRQPWVSVPSRQWSF